MIQQLQVIIDWLRDGNQASGLKVFPTREVDQVRMALSDLLVAERKREEAVKTKEETKKK